MIPRGHMHALLMIRYASTAAGSSFSTNHRKADRIVFLKIKNQVCTPGVLVVEVERDYGMWTVEPTVTTQTLCRRTSALAYGQLYSTTKPGSRKIPVFYDSLH